jgi:hypothetical protein
MLQTVRNEKGIALAIAMFAMVVIGGLVAGAFFAGTQESRIGENTRYSAVSFTAAEAGISRRLARWNTDSLNTLAVGDSLVIASQPIVTGGRGEFAGSIRRLNQETFVVTMTGTEGAGFGRSRVGMLVKLRVAEMDIRAALTTRGTTQIGGSSFINGNDTPSWTDCPAAGAPESGIRIDDPTKITTSGCSSLACVAGSPKVEADPGLDTSTFFKFGDMSWAELVATANVRIVGGGNLKPEPTVSMGQCEKTNQQNWGEPNHLFLTNAPCFSYFPIVHISGYTASTSLNGVRGQGILLVDGDLSVQGGFEFYGPVIVRGRLKTTGTGGHFNGGVMAANVDLEQNTVLGDAVINFDRCALLRALQASAAGTQMRSRGWAMLF